MYKEKDKAKTDQSDYLVLIILDFPCSTGYFLDFLAAARSIKANFSFTSNGIWDRPELIFLKR